MPLDEQHSLWVMVAVAAMSVAITVLLELLEAVCAGFRLLSPQLLNGYTRVAVSFRGGAEDQARGVRGREGRKQKGKLEADVSRAVHCTVCQVALSSDGTVRVIVRPYYG